LDKKFTAARAFVNASWQRYRSYFTGALAKESDKKTRLISAAKAVAVSGGLVVALLILYTAILIPFTPSIADLRKEKADKPSVLLSTDGKQIAVYTRLHREWVRLDQVSPNVVNALVATEDHRFFEHHGIDFKRTLASAVHSLSGDTQGGSTITQQLARNLYPEEIGRSRSITRKLKELITALKIERAYTKKEILETYLNTVPFLYNAFGIEMAARTYFDKPASRLDVLESATLIGMLKGNSYYNPVINPERAVNRRNVVLTQMRKHALLTEANLNTLKKRPIRLHFERQEIAVGPAPHFAEHVRKWLLEWAADHDYNIYLDGLVVTTTIDSRVQAAANEAVTRELNALQAVADVEWSLSSDRLLSSSTSTYVNMRRRVQGFGYFWETKNNTVDAFIRESAVYRNAVEAGGKPDETLALLRKDAKFIAALKAEKTRLQTGFVAMDPTNGEVRAWVGSRDYLLDQFDHVARAQRQPGSTFKPFVYGTALEQGMSPERTFIDQAVQIPLGHGQFWRPADLDAPSGRSMTIREGLAYSKNTITAQVMQVAGPKNTAELARKMGIRDSKLDPVMALALGTSPVTALEMATAYSSIANGGEYRKPLLVTRINDRSGKLLAEFSNAPERAMEAGAAKTLLDMLRGVIDRGTGQAIRTRYGIRADVAGKTGTTQNNTDGWFMLMHPQLVVGSWVGFNDARVTMRSNYWGQGAHTALLVVGDFFKRALDTRMIDANLRFGQQDNAPIGNKVEEWLEWLGREKPQPAPQPEWPAANSQPEPETETPQDELNRLLDQARRERREEDGVPPDANADDRAQPISREEERPQPVRRRRPAARPRMEIW
jgi:penicillin-binding protein 1A